MTDSTPCACVGAVGPRNRACEGRVRGIDDARNCDGCIAAYGVPARKPYPPKEALRPLANAYLIDAPKTRAA